MPSRIAIALLTFLLGSVVVMGIAGAQEDIASRMEARLPVIDALKAKGIIGENNNGYLAFIGPRTRTDVVNAENADRAALFERIATQQGTTPDLVGRRFALKFRNLTRAGEWYQDDAGNWRKK